MGPLVTGLVVPLGQLMQGILKTQGITVAGNLEHGRVKVVPYAIVACVPEYNLGYDEFDVL